MPQVNNPILQTQSAALLHDAYQKYGSMLYGYLLNAVKDQELAGQYLVSIFDDLSQSIKQTGECGPYSWCGLYRMAKVKLINTSKNILETADHEILVYALGNEMYNGMNDLQKRVFYESYYNGKRVAELATNLNQSEELIRKALKEAFLVLRRSGS